MALAAASDEAPISPAVLDDFNDALHLSGRHSAQQLGVLTFNMEHKDKPDRLAIMAQHLRSDLRELPEFVLCQEVKFERSKRKGEDNTAAVLGDELGYYCKGTKRTSDNEGVAILSRYPFAYYDSRELKSQTSRLLLGFNRVSIMGEFMVPGIGRVRVVNVHLTNWGFEHHVRVNQIRETLEWVAQREQTVKADVTILGGDFNMPPDGDERQLVTDHANTGTLEFQDFNTSNPSRGSYGSPSMRVDYMFIATPKCDMRFMGEDRLFIHGLKDNAGGSRFYLSDHVPVLHEYAVSPHTLMATSPAIPTPVAGAQPIKDATAAAEVLR